MNKVLTRFIARFFHFCMILVSFFFLYMPSNVIATKPRVLIVTHSYNKPDFIELQYKLFKKFLHDDYDFVVFNDASNATFENAISAICKALNIVCL